MKIYQIYFSPTGGTKKVTKIISDSFACDKEDIDLLNPKEELSEYKLTSEDICLVAVPSFGGRVPETALNQIKKIKGENARTILIVAYGNRAFEDTLIELKDTLEYAGFSCIAAIAAVTEHSIMHEYGTKRPDEKDRKELEAFANQIKGDLSHPSERKELHIPGNRPYREYKGVPFKPEANKNCTQCKRCVKECPVHAIPKENPASVDKTKCISCMHCIAICPQKARHNNKMLLFAASQKMKKKCSDRKENKLFR